jgi:hypothetical protein
MKIDVFTLNYQDAQHAQDMLFLPDNYALDPMGGATALNQTVKDNLAKNAYLKFGFAGYALDPQMGKALFWEKPL